MADPFGKNCPWQGCRRKVVRVTGNADAQELSVRCEDGHRSAATRAKGHLTPDPEGESLAALTEGSI